MAAYVIPIEPAPTKARFSRFVAAYVAVFVLLAACGALVVERKIKLADHSALFTRTGFATDLAYVDLPRMTISMSSSQSGAGGGGPAAPRVRMDISLEIASKDVSVVQGYQPRMMDRMNGFLAALKVEQLKDANSLAWMREQLLTQVNSVGSPAPVHDVMFRQFVVM